MHEHKQQDSSHFFVEELMMVVYLRTMWLAGESVNRVFPRKLELSEQPVVLWLISFYGILT